MFRRLFAAASVVSLLLCAATVALWVRSYWVVDNLAWVCRDMAQPEWVEEWFTKWLRTNSRRGILSFDFEQIDWSKVHPGSGQLVRQWQWRFDGWTKNDPSHTSSELPDPRFENVSILNRCGFALRNESTLALWGDWDSQFKPAHEIGFCCPLWIFPLVTGLIPAWKLKRSLARRSRARTARCIDCGYDLRANTSGVCPECGTLMQPKAEA